MVITPNGHYTEWSLHRMVITPNGHYTKWSLHRMVITQNVHYTKWSLHRMVITPNGHLKPKIDLAIPIAPNPITPNIVFTLKVLWCNGTDIRQFLGYT